MQDLERSAILADPFVAHYLGTMLQDLENQELGREDGPPRPVGSVWDLSPQLLRDAKADCDGFRAAVGTALLQAEREHGYREAQAGSDFWLTRVGHGAGYWDRGLGALGDQLTAACGYGTPYGTLDPDVGPDGVVTLS